MRNDICRRLFPENRGPEPGRRLDDVRARALTVAARIAQATQEFVQTARSVNCNAAHAEPEKKAAQR